MAIKTIKTARDEPTINPSQELGLGPGLPEFNELSRAMVEVGC